MAKMSGSLRDIRLFIAAYEERSFTAAAIRENATQSGVSQHIRKLEELHDLGVTQFNIYLMCGDEEKQVAAYSKSVIPYFNRKSTRVVKPKAVAKKKVVAQRRRK